MRCTARLVPSGVHGPIGPVFALVRGIAVALILVFALTVSGNAAAEGFRAVASIKPVHSILAGLMAGGESPGLLMRGDGLPYEYDLDAAARREIASADLIVWIGPELEPHLVETLAATPQKARVVTLLDSRELKILPSRWHESARDPYFWLDSRNGIILIDELTRELVRTDPGRSHLYKRNRVRLHERMSRLDRKLEFGYRALTSARGLAYYDTQQYFEQAYAVDLGNALLGSPAATLSAVELLDGRARLMSGDFACLLVERPMAAAHLELLLQGVDINVGYLDSLGAGFTAGPDLYFDMMEHNTAAIRNCLKQTDIVKQSAAEADESAAAAEIGGRFLLMDHDGNLFADADMLGKYQLIFFGYVYCPDVCPTSLLTLAQALELLGERSDAIQPYFITVDPERDTPEVVRNYVRFFSEDLIGLTGTQAMVSRVAEQYNVQFEKIVVDGAQEGAYAMDHTSSFFLMAPDGRFVTKFAYGISPAQLAEKLGEYVR